MREKWPPWLIHWLKGKPSNFQPHNGKLYWLRKYAEQKRFQWFWPTFLAEKLEEIFGFEVNVETLRLNMVKRWLWTVKKRHQKVERSKRERRSQYGMLSQFDWSYHIWLEDGKVMCLLAAVDDATSDLVYWSFSEGESLEDVLKFWIEYMKRYGKPQAIYVDCHSSYKVNHPKDQFDDEKRTRFERWMRKLWIDVIFAKCPEWKWRVERWFKTHQDRLIKEMRLRGIKTYEEANKYLDGEYRIKHNEMFWKQASEAWNYHTKLTIEEVKNIERCFGIETERTMKKDWTISYKKITYQLEKGQLLSNYKLIKVIESINWDIKLYSWTNELRFNKVWVK